MVAKAVEQFTFRIPLCTGRPMLIAADDALERGDELRCAIFLREAITRYLRAHCESRNLKIRSGYTPPKTLIKAIRKSGFDLCSLVDEVIDACNKIAHCQRSDVNLKTCLSIAWAVFGNDFQREGGEL